MNSKNICSKRVTFLQISFYFLVNPLINGNDFSSSSLLSRGPYCLIPNKSLILRRGELYPPTGFAMTIVTKHMTIIISFRNFMATCWVIVKAQMKLNLKIRQVEAFIYQWSEQQKLQTTWVNGFKMFVI